ncbi:MAG: sigma-70 family RNA polymerase sigma factor [Solirubrobacterales bacterium]|nr:sigma-70 family RNA polymerase sigma factor [Solirubrobacterales bacterium]
MDLETLIETERGALVARLTAALSGDRHSAEELVQETMLRAWERLPAGLSDAQQRAWLGQTAKRLALDELRRRRRRPSAPLEDDVAAFEDQDADAAREALSTLPPHERFVLMLRFDAGFSHLEIAQLLDISEAAARKRISRARTQFMRAYRLTQGDRDPLILLIESEDPPEPYVDLLQTAGARVRRVKTVRERDLALADGVVHGGGYVDMHPALYGQPVRWPQGEPNLERDRLDLAALCGALSLDLPLLGICRGAQLLNVASGGDLYQDVVNEGLTRVEHKSDHVIDTAREGTVRSLLGRRAEVASSHHQAVHRLGRNLRVGATSPDGVIETIERRDKRFAVGLQWHPEFNDYGPGKLVAEGLVEAARERIA